ncbi:glucocorticoid modulatory element-binding protein 1-like [Phyllopteryx taeniolatus]|uniref:glucocorticoid modulatory element-binding protein 1-like n=1 Tax=Phyllopteryx taeniolatus TaxID=161469 RepID=UPI002AD471D7|nr:glucocorticoid modulatory element-binding protein 1-like [Phyllopteryx taeniolatus]XP_061631417.1 glucocorticoid modulatory element-binding protein 1-like [Phyllopteryx taeniolatus]
MMEKEEEGGSSGNNHKAQVILHLQPLLHGGNYDIADTSSTVLAIETQHDDSKSEGENVEYGYPITCGESRAVLLFKKFVCPGINVRCVKFNDQLISPKQFVHLAGKATLKDWKRAIRLGGVMLRKMMDSGQIDFYQHATVCSNTCRSTKFDMLINSSQLPLGTSVPNPSSVAFESLGGQVPPLTGESLHDAADLEESLDDRFGGEWSSAHLTTANGHPKRKRNDTPDGILSLWKGVAECGLMGEVLSGLQAHLLTALKGVEVRSEKAELQETDAIILNSLCEMFGLLDSVKQALEQRRSQKEDDDDDDDDDGVYGLEELSKERRKQACIKSTSYKHASPKHLRPQRHQPSNSQLSPTLSNTVIQPLSLTGLPEPPYTHPNINPQHVSHFPTSGGPRAGHVRREERTRALCESGKHARARKAGQELTFEMQQDLEQRACKLQAQLGSEKLGEAERLHGCEKVAMGRKGLKKLKTK